MLLPGAAARRLVQQMGLGKWTPMAHELNAELGLRGNRARTGKQCRERWHHQLKPGINKVGSRGVQGGDRSEQGSGGERVMGVQIGVNPNVGRMQ